MREESRSRPSQLKSGSCDGPVTPPSALQPPCRSAEDLFHPRCGKRAHCCLLAQTARGMQAGAELPPTKRATTLGWQHDAQGQAAGLEPGAPRSAPPEGAEASEESLVTADHHSQLGQPPCQDGRASSWTADFSFTLCPVQKPKDLSGRLVLMRLCCYPQFAQYFVCSSPQRPAALRSIQRLGPATHWNQSKQLPQNLQTSAAWQSQ